MLQEIISYINTLDPALIYLVLLFFSFAENIFPPSPSDLVVVFVATLIDHTSITFISVLLITTAGSTIGFITMYYIGKFLGERIIRTGKLKFIKKESLEKADGWFNKYGYKIILINRFMPGTRAVVSFFSGVHKLKQIETFIFAGLSSLVWNALLILLGIFLGNNINLIDKYLKTYSNIILVITALVAGYFLIRYLLKKKKKC
jgi:membrane protein DedA with SNARE-associated domain